MIKLIQRLRNLILSVFAACTSTLVYAQGASLGDVAGNANNVTDMFTNLFSDVFYVIGTAFIVASAIQFREHHDNPSQTPISRPVLFLIIGLVIGLFPLMLKITTGKLPTLS